MSDGRPGDRVVLVEERLAFVFVRAWKEGWRRHPPSALEASPDPREFDAPSREACWADFLTWASFESDVMERSHRTLTELFSRAWEAARP